jgi:hypothetical protein
MMAESAALHIGEVAFITTIRPTDSSIAEYAYSRKGAAELSAPMSA